MKNYTLSIIISLTTLRRKEKRIKLIFIALLETLALIIMFIKSGQCQADRTQLIDILLKRRLWKNKLMLWGHMGAMLEIKLRKTRMIAIKMFP